MNRKNFISLILGLPIISKIFLKPKPKYIYIGCQTFRITSEHNYNIQCIKKTYETKNLL